MLRLNDRAFEILHKEIERCVGHSPSHQVQRELVLKRLQRLRAQQGSPLGEKDLQREIVDMLPAFNLSVLRAAARANRPSGSMSLIKTWVVMLGGLAGFVYVANLPIALIRRPLSQHAPLVLLPSYISMDYHYRQAVALVEQADQLVNGATSPDDLELGTVKVADAKYHLDQLPVWFLEPGYRSQFWWYGRYTIDEFRRSREEIGRMEAKLFQEKNAQVRLKEGEEALASAKKAYQQALEPTQKATALAQWQAALDQLAQIPQATLAGEQARSRLRADQRDFEQVAGVAKGSARSDNLVQAAKGFALAASQAAQNPPHSVTEWQEIVQLWMKAIDRLETLSVDDLGYVEAQRLLATYQTNLSIARVQLQREKTATEALEEAQRLTERLISSASSDHDRYYLIGQLQRIITQLRKVTPNTTAYSEAQQLLESAEGKLAALQKN